MKLLVVSEISGVSINDSLAQLVKNLAVQSIEIEFYNPRSESNIESDLKSFAASIILNSLSNKISSADYVIVDSRLGNEFYDLSSGMLYGKFLDSVYIYQDKEAQGKLSTALMNRKTNEPFDSDSILVSLNPESGSVGYDELFYKLAGSSVSKITFDGSSSEKLKNDNLLIGLIWAIGTIKVVANLETDNPYLKALLNRC